MSVLKDLTGKTFGHLKVIKRDEEKIGKDHGAWWICKCNCGNVVSIRGRCLLRPGGNSTHKTQYYCSYGCAMRLVDQTNKTLAKMDRPYDYHDILY